MTDNANGRQVGGSHYQSSIQHWDFIEKHTIGYIEGCATKYVTRWRRKNGPQDLEKAQHYVEKLVEMHHTIDRHPRGWANPIALRQFVEANDLNAKEEEVINILCSRWTPDSLKVAIGLIEELRESVKKYDKEDSTGQEHPFGYPGHN